MLDYGFFDITIILVKILICGVAVMSALFGGYLHISRPNHVDHPAPAGFWRRAGAAMIDYSILAVACSVPGLAAMLIAETATQANSQAMMVLAGLAFLIVIGAPVGFWIYCAAMESSARQATLGKALLGLRVIDLDGHRITFSQATLRHFGKILSMLSFCFGYYLAGWSHKKQALHDIPAKCLVVRADTQ